WTAPAGWLAGRLSGWGDGQWLSPAEYGSGLIIEFTFHLRRPAGPSGCAETGGVSGNPLWQEDVPSPILFCGAMVDCR
ncbi:MAG TPA: hypothetical protein VJS86_13675, partial [Arthrobacter sp.]|nr:hypothetical protein [Arthrobacter sp.]